MQHFTPALMSPDIKTEEHVLFSPAPPFIRFTNDLKISFLYTARSVLHTFTSAPIAMRMMMGGISTLPFVFASWLNDLVALPPVELGSTE